MRSKGNYHQRAPIYDILGPLGWTYKMLADAVQCSVSTVRRDLSSRGGLKGAYPERPTGNNVYSATFLYYTRQSFPDGHVQRVAEDFLEVGRIVLVSEGMGRAIVALQVFHHPPEVTRYVSLLQNVVGNNRRTALWDASDVCWWWVNYTESVKDGQIPPPKSAEEALNAITLLFQESVRRLDIYLPMPPGLREAMDAVLATLTDNERRVIVMRFGLDEGSEPRTLEEVGLAMEVTLEEAGRIEHRALWWLQHPSYVKPLQWFVRDLRACLRDEKLLRRRIRALEAEADILRDECGRLIADST